MIVDKNQSVYEKIPVDAKHMQLSSRYMLGTLPIVTTATNAMYYQKLIATSLISTECTYCQAISSVHGTHEQSCVAALSGWLIPAASPVLCCVKDLDDSLSTSTLSVYLKSNPTSKIFNLSTFVSADVIGINTNYIFSALTSETKKWPYKDGKFSISRVCDINGKTEYNVADFNAISNGFWDETHSVVKLSSNDF